MAIATMLSSLIVVTQLHGCNTLAMLPLFPHGDMPYKMMWASNATLLLIPDGLLSSGEICIDLPNGPTLKSHVGCKA